MTNRYVAWVDGVWYIARPIVLVGALALSAAAHAHGHCGQANMGHAVARADYGHHATHAETTTTQAASVTSTTSNGYFAYKNGDGQTGDSLVDGFQPWPESEMRQFQKQ